MRYVFIVLETGWHGYSCHSFLLSVWFIQPLPRFINSKSVRFLLGSRVVNNILFMFKYRRMMRG